MSRPKLLILPLLLLATLSTTHCVRDEGDTRSFGRSRNSGFSGVSMIRSEALKETALAIGAQRSLALRYAQIDKTLDLHARALDRTFNFESLLLKDNVLPPVLLEGRDTVKTTGDAVLRITDRTFHIKSQARFTPIAPQWRDYLYKKYAEPDAPHDTLLPRNSAERTIWNKAYQQGWDEGLRQAERTFSDNLARLREDYNGMVTYRKLLAQGMVSQPFVAVTELGVTSDSKNMGINDKILRIVVMPQFQDPNNWNPALSHKTLSMNELGFGGLASKNGAPTKAAGDDTIISQHIIGHDDR